MSDKSLQDAENEYNRNLKEMEVDLEAKRKEEVGPHLSEVASLHEKNKKERVKISSKRDSAHRTIDNTEREEIAKAKSKAKSERSKADRQYDADMEAFSTEVAKELEPHNSAVAKAEENFVKGKRVRTEEIRRQYDAECTLIRARVKAESDAKTSASGPLGNPA